ncbi:ShlB/FhaC/HecB family hemolysin secretion/activation protein [Pseudothauera nasutitermitis]|nr:ShlB/FhaC/HecB family hemolysin secretion/activation protein [Pseudothauera nasutitermitis]
MLRALSLASSLTLLAATAHADELRHAAPPEVPPLAPSAPLPAPQAPSVLPADETPLLAALRGIVLVPDTSEASLQRLATGVDVSAVPLTQPQIIAAHLQASIGQPASLASLQRLANDLTRLLREQGRVFVSVWVPPQDLTDGVVRIAVVPALMEGPMQVTGAEHFSDESYLKWIRQQPGVEPDAARLQEDIDWINRNPFRNATLAAAPGSTPDTTLLALRVRERRPVRVFAGLDNTGTENTDEQRIFAGFNWGNAFGRGDQLSYQYRADPSRKHSITHSGSYLADLPWRHWIALSGAWSETTPDLGPTFDQKGESWQVGAQYHVPLPTLPMDQTVLRQDFYVGLDFKYSNNNLEFATIPVMDNKTDVAQLTLGYSLNREGANSSSFISPQLVLSPGGLSKYNTDEAFDGSRFGAKARYAYFKLDAEHSQRLPAGFRWDVRGNAQYSNAPLLGSEQIAGSGTYAVRGYPESQAFGDKGVVLRNELHLPPLPLGGLNDVSLDTYVFYDLGWLRTVGLDAESIHLSSIGFGASLRLAQALSLDMSVGRPLEKNVAGADGTRVNFRLQVAY